MQTTLSRFFTGVPEDTPSKPSKPVSSPPPKKKLRKSKDTDDSNTDEHVVTAEEHHSVEKESPKKKKSTFETSSSEVSVRKRVIDDDDEEEEEEEQESNDPLIKAMKNVEFDPKLHERCVKKLCLSRVEKGSDASDECSIDGGYQHGMIKGLPAGIRRHLTPMEQTVVQMKEEHPDLVLLFEVGYKFKLFGEDALLAKRILRVCAFVDHNFLTAMVPVVRVNFHVKRLVAAGHKVGLVKQTEVAAVKALSDNKGKPFSRALTNVYTPATLVGVDLDDDAMSSNTDQTESPIPNKVSTSSLPKYILALCEEIPSQTGQRLAFLAADLSNGEVVYSTLVDDPIRSSLGTVLAHLRPVELLTPPLTSMTQSTVAVLNHQKTLGAMITELQTWAEEYAPTASRDAISSFFEGANEQQRNAVLSLPDGVMCCLAALIEYLAQFGLNRSLLLTATFRPFSQGRTMLLPGPTISNLELFANNKDGGERGTLSSLLCGTKTSFGRRMMRRWISAPLCDVDRIKARQDAVTEILEHHSSLDVSESTVSGIGNPTASDCITQICAALNGLPDIERGLCHIQHQRCTVKEFISVMRALKNVSSILPSREHAEASLHSSLLRETLTSIPNVYANAETHLSCINEKSAETNNSSGMVGIFSDISCFPKIVESENRVKEDEETLHKCLEKARTALNKPVLQYTHQVKEPYVLELPNRVKVPNDWIKINGTASVTRWRTPTMITALAQLERDRALLHSATEECWREFLADVSRADYGVFREVVYGLATLDCLVALSRLAVHDGYVRPEMLHPDEQPGQILDIVDGRNPVAETLISDVYVPNSLQLSNAQDEDNPCGQCAVITGPNMGGKSCFLRQVALIAVLAQIGSYVPAAKVRLTPFDAIYTRMGIGDNIEKGQSTYFVEMCETSPILRDATSRSLVVLDELGRGTSTHDGTAIAYGALCHLLKHSRSLTLFVTHYSHLAESSEVVFPSLVRNYHMSFMDNRPDGGSDVSTSDSITFLFKLVSGVSPGSFGVNVARIAGFPPDLIQRASSISQEYSARQNSTSSAAPSVRLRIASTLVSDMIHSIRSNPDDHSTLLAPSENIRSIWLTSQRFQSISSSQTH